MSEVEYEHALRNVIRRGAFILQEENDRFEHALQGFVGIGAC
jgi:hypothetical protein